MKRASTLKRGKPLARSASKLSRSARMKPVGKRGAADREAIESVRAVVLARARDRCERCGARGRLDLHHRLARSQGGTHDAANLVALCRSCHDGVTFHRVEDWSKWVETRRGAA